MGVFPNYPELEALKLKEGRFINERDMAERRKVMILHEKTVGMLFPARTCNRKIRQCQRSQLSDSRGL